MKPDKYSSLKVQPSHCSLQRLIEKPLPQSQQTLLESLQSWKPMKTAIGEPSSSFTELFGELHFREAAITDSSSPSSLPLSTPSSLTSSSLSFLDAYSVNNDSSLTESDFVQQNKTLLSYYSPGGRQYKVKDNDSFESKSTERLSLCTEGLGFESCDNVEKTSTNGHSFLDWHDKEKKHSVSRHGLRAANQHPGYKRSRAGRGLFPPPISCIGRDGKPWVRFKRYRQDGRFILEEIRLPKQKFLQSSREDGRLMMQFIHSDDEIVVEEEDEDREDDENGVEEVDEGRAEK